MYELSFQTPWHRPYRDGIRDSGGGGQGIFVDFAFHSPPQFVLELWSAMADSLGVKVHQTTAYHPQTNGMCEQLHESLKAALWGSLTGLRCAVWEDLWDSPAELVLGQPLRQRPEKHDRNTTMQPIQYNSAVVYKGHQSEGSSLSACFRAEAAAVVWVEAQSATAEVIFAVSTFRQ